MIVLGAVLGYIAPFVKRRLLSTWLADVPLDFLPEKLRLQLKPQGRSQKARFTTPANNIAESDVELQPEFNAGSKSEIQTSEAVKMSQQHKKDIEAANHFSQLATQRKQELDTYRADVKEHFVDLAKVINDDYDGANDMNQALINQIGVGAEQLVGARSMKDTLSEQPLSQSSSQSLKPDVAIESAHVNAPVVEGEEWIPVEAEEEIDAFFEDTKSIQAVDVNGVDLEGADLRQEFTVTSDVQDNSSLGLDMNSSLDMDIPDSYDRGQNTAKYANRENRFQEIADGIEGKSGNTFAGVKNWFKGVASAASASLPKRNIETSDESLEISPDIIVNPKDVPHYKDAPHYDEDGVLVDTSVLDSQWDFNSVVSEGIDDLNENVVQQSSEQAIQESIPQFGARQDASVDSNIEATIVAEDLRSDFIYQGAAEENINNDDAPVAKQNPYGEAVKYLGLQQGLAAGSSQAADLQNAPVIEPQLNIDTGIITDKITTSQPHTSEMLDPYDRITDAVLKESSSLNMNDEKKIVHELFYVRGHQSNISGRAMSNINPGIRKDN